MGRDRSYYLHVAFGVAVGLLWGVLIGVAMLGALGRLGGR